ncbi:MAG: apolipoprotein N-acyltransferase [Nitrospiraceae bacterium]|nr:apolipoprotein N-acyltransferase [Nitrospiraceae bacterium]
MRGNGTKYLMSAFSGLMLVFTFAPYGLFGLAWVALVPFFLSIEEMPASAAAKAGFTMGFFYFFGTTYWIYHSMHDYGGMGLVTSLAIVIALASYLSLYTAAFALLYTAKIRHTKAPALLVAPVLWVSLEYLRSYFLTGFPWSTLGYSQWNFLRVIQIADITGVYGISFLLVAVNAAVADFFLIKRRMKRMPLYPLSYVVTGYICLAGLLAATFLYGSFRLKQIRPGHPLKVSIVQGDIDQSEKWDQRYENQVFSIYKNLTTGAIDQTPNLIVWPESSLPFAFNDQEPAVKELENIQGASHIPVLIGAMRQRSSGNFSNSAVLIAGGRPAYFYDKIHLVPFGEYVPLKKVLFFVNKLSDAIGDFEPGDDYTQGGIGHDRFATLICYEMAFPGLVRKFFRTGGDFMVTITNDAWFGRSTGPYQNWSMAALRAVENRKPVIRAANSGISGFFTSSGAVIEHTGLFERRTVTATVMTDSTITFYTRFGDLFSYLSILTALFMLIFSDEKNSF